MVLPDCRGKSNSSDPARGFPAGSGMAAEGQALLVKVPGLLSVEKCSRRKGMDFSQGSQREPTPPLVPLADQSCAQTPQEAASCPQESERFLPHISALAASCAREGGRGTHRAVTEDAAPTEQRRGESLMNKDYS